MISGSGARMQGTSYLPGYYHVIDKNAGGSGSLWQMFNNVPACKIGRIYNVLTESSSSGAFLASNEEILRQTMLKHEAIFRTQVHELHRLYGRQRELMNEISRNHLKMQASHSRFIPSEVQCNIFQNALQIRFPLLDGKPTAQGGENFQMPSTAESLMSKQAGFRIYLKENALEEQRVSSSKSRYSGKRVLDLELPAEEYIDSEDEEGLEYRSSVQVPQVQDDPSKTASQLPRKSSLKLNEASSSNGSSSYSKNTFLFDLNEPIQLDESETPISANFIDSCTEIMPHDQDPFQKSKSGSPVRNEESIYPALERKGNEGNNLFSGLQDSSAGGSPIFCVDGTSLVSEVAKTDNEIFDDNNQSMLSSCITNSCSPVLISKEAKTEGSTSVSSQKTSLHNLKDIPFAIQALPCFNNTKLLSKASRSSAPKSGIKRKYYNSKRNPAYSPSLRSVSCCITGNSDNEHAAEDSSLKDSNRAKSSEDMDYTCFPGTVTSQDKNRITDGGSSSKNSKGLFNWPTVKPDYDGTNLDAPVSPENKEHPPPRGKSEENQVEMSSHILKQKTGDPNEALDRIAAEAIISISSLSIQQCLKNDRSVALEVLSESLTWFAGLVSSVTGDPEIELERLLNDASSSDHNALATGEREHSAAMVLKLTEIKVEDECPETSSQKIKTIAGIMSPSHQEEKSRPRKTRQRKGFLSGQPCIAPLPSTDVTENLQQTEHLITAAGRTSGSLPGHRNVGRNGRGRRSRSSKMVSSHDAEGRVCSLLKQHISEIELSFTLKSLLGWGRKHRRQKIRRARMNYCLLFD